MAEIDHWHPVLLSKALDGGPQGVRIAGREIVVFRTRGGAVGALEDVCPHRGMRLSCGSVHGERLMCPYHGWTYDIRGAGESPGTPKLHADAQAYEACERHGAVWVRAAEGRREGALSEPIPDLRYSGYFAFDTVWTRIEAPVEPVLDNFCEVEHTPTTHIFFGYDLDAMAKVETRVEVTDLSVRVVNRGRQKPIPRLLEPLARVYGRDTFIDDWTTYFSPLHIIYDQHWEDPRTGLPRPTRIRLAVFFTPVDDRTTDVLVCAFSTLEPYGRFGLNALILPWVAKIFRDEVLADKRMVEALADKRPGLEGRKLSRFDKALGENRRRLASVYRGARPEAAAAP